MPEYTAEEARTRKTFLALMNALSFPGRIQRLPADGRAAYIAIADTLLDLETSFYTPSDWLAVELAATGARPLAPARAAYHFYPHALLLDQIRQANPGTLMYPDAGATLIVAAALNNDDTIYLSGPGIPTEMLVRIGGIEAGFWTLREKVSRYPLGWDIFLVDNDQVMGLPRTTQMRFENAG